MNFGFENMKNKAKAVTLGTLAALSITSAKAEQAPIDVLDTNQTESVINSQENLQVKLDSISQEERKLEKILSDAERDLEAFENTFYKNYQSVESFLQKNSKKTADQWKPVKDLLSLVETEIESMAKMHNDKDLSQDTYRQQFEKNFKNYNNNKTGKIVFVMDNVMKGQMGAVVGTGVGGQTEDIYLHAYFGKIISEATTQYTQMTEITKKIDIIKQEKQDVLNQLGATEFTQNL